MNKCVLVGTFQDLVAQLVLIFNRRGPAKADWPAALPCSQMTTPRLCPCRRTGQNPARQFRLLTRPVDLTVTRRIPATTGFFGRSGS